MEKEDLIKLLPNGGEGSDFIAQTVEGLREGLDEPPYMGEDIKRRNCRETVNGIVEKIFRPLKYAGARQDVIIEALNDSLLVLRSGLLKDRRLIAYFEDTELRQARIKKPSLQIKMIDDAFELTQKAQKEGFIKPLERNAVYAILAQAAWVEKDMPCCIKIVDAFGEALQRQEMGTPLYPYYVLFARLVGEEGVCGQWGDAIKRLRKIDLQAAKKEITSVLKDGQLLKKKKSPLRERAMQLSQNFSKLG